jgi:uncharacterized membrane protein
LYYGFEGWARWWMPFMGMGMLLFWGVVIGLVVWGIRSFSHSNTNSTESERPLEIAERRYAQGEITLQKFEEIKTSLGQEDPREVEDTLQGASRS